MWRMVLPICLISSPQRNPKLVLPPGGPGAQPARLRRTRPALTRAVLATLSLPVLLSSAQAVQSVSLGWDANTETDLAGYRVRYGTASGNYTNSTNLGATTTATTVPNLLDGVRYYLAVTAYNKSGLESAPSNEVSFLNGVAVISPSIWPGSALPATVDGGADNPVELGVKFRSDTAGLVSGIRFYKAATNTGIHTGSLWTSAGTKLATATFSAETASGWQEVRFTTPVAVSANTTYVASYHSNSGHYSLNLNAFANSGVDNAPLHALSSTESSGNGVYAYGAGSTFPNASWNATNYWVDVLFQTGKTALNISTAALPGARVNTPYTATLAASGGTAPYSWAIASGALPAGLTLNAATGAITGTATAAGTFNFTAKVTDSSSPVQTFTKALSLTLSQSTVATSLWPATVIPGVVDGGADSPVELGMRFKSDLPATVTAIRFYKAAANTGTHVGTLWSNSGERLATATFTGESASGWQQVNLATPVAIAANTVYVVSYHANNGHYSADRNYFATNGVDNPPLHGLANGTSGANGVYIYGATPAFPTQTWNACNYWVDVVIKPN